MGSKWIDTFVWELNLTIYVQKKVFWNANVKKFKHFTKQFLKRNVNFYLFYFKNELLQE